MKRILCATDGSQSAEKAVTYAIKLAKQTEAELTFIHVVLPSAGDVSQTFFWDSNIVHTSNENIQLELHQAMGLAHQHQLRPVYCTTVPGQNIATAIIEYARKNAHDHLVAGATGFNQVTRMLGSIAQQITHKAHCPVTVVR